MTFRDLHIALRPPSVAIPANIRKSQLNPF